MLFECGEFDEDDDVLLQVVGRGGRCGYEGSDPLDGGVEAVVDGKAGGMRLLGLDSELVGIRLPVQVVFGDGRAVFGLASKEDRGDTGWKTSRLGS